MFSGQGSQYFQMAKALFMENNTFKHHMLKANDICQDLIHSSVVNYLYDNTHSIGEPFTRTLFSHPAIFMVEYALTQVLLENNIHPDFVLGTSMGEFAAATLTGALTLESALRAVTQQAQLFEKYCEPGGMLAILYSPTLYQTESFINQQSELAAVNFDAHFVVSGSIDHLNAITTWLNEKHIISQILPVSFAFHSSLMDDIEIKFIQEIQAIQLAKPNLPIFSCTQARALNELTHNHFWEIIRLPILFQKTIQQIESQEGALYIDVGPSGTLATFVKYNLRQNSPSKQLVILTPFEKTIAGLQIAIRECQQKT